MIKVVSTLVECSIPDVLVLGSIDVDGVALWMVVVCSIDVWLVKLEVVSA